MKNGTRITPSSFGETVLVDEFSANYLQGAIVDYHDDLNGAVKSRTRMPSSPAAAEIPSRSVLFQHLAKFIQSSTYDRNAVNIGGAQRNVDGEIGLF